MISGDGISKAIVKIRKNSITHQDEPHRYEPKTTEKKKLVFHRAGNDYVPNNTVYHTSIHIEQAINKDIPIFQNEYIQQKKLSSRMHSVETLKIQEDEYHMDSDLINIYNKSPSHQKLSPKQTQSPF
jgi:hypothetical protein